MVSRSRPIDLSSQQYSFAADVQSLIMNGLREMGSVVREMIELGIISLRVYILIGLCLFHSCGHGHGIRQTALSSPTDDEAPAISLDTKLQADTYSPSSNDLIRRLHGAAQLRPEYIFANGRTKDAQMPHIWMTKG